MKRIAFVAYETRYAPAGGVAAVMNRLPMAVSSAAGGAEVLVVTPFHHRIKSTSDLRLKLKEECTFKVKWLEHEKPVTILRGEDGHLFVHVHDEEFFAGRPHPYLVPPDDLRRDALMFGAASWRGLSEVYPGSYWTLFLQDWQAATLVFSAATSAQPPDMVLTLHNSYDTGLTDKQLIDFGLTGSFFPVRPY